MNTSITFRNWTSTLFFFFILIQLSAQPLRVENLQLEPIIYSTAQGFPTNTHAFVTFNMLPGADLEYFNARFTHPETGDIIWSIRNVPIPPLTDVQKLSYSMNVEAFSGIEYPFLICEYDVSPIWQTDAGFTATGFTTLVPQNTIFQISSGSDDPALLIGSFIPPIYPPILLPPSTTGWKFRGCSVPNIDLDYSKFYPAENPIPSDYNACGPAAAANSLHWLVQQHLQLSSDTSTLREKLDLLKKFMNMQKDDNNGVRFDSMVVGKLALIDSLKLPVRVKYKTMHESGNTDEPLVSTNPKYGHAADNKGKLGVHPDFEWYRDEIEDGEDVEVHVGWYGEPDSNGVRPRHGGHWLVATGYFESDFMRGIFLKDDKDQSSSNADSLRHQFYKWDTLPSGEPYLRGLTTTSGHIGIVESMVSESYDPDIVFEDITIYEWTLKILEYLAGSMYSYPYHGWFTFMLPASTDFQYLNAIISSPDTSVEAWILDNVPLPDVPSPFPVRIKIDLADIVTGDTLPSKIVMKYHIGEFQLEDTFPIQSYAILDLGSEPFFIASGGAQNIDLIIPKSPPIIILPTIPGIVESHLRGCEVPNIDLDTNKTQTDLNACGPAAAANSLQWLEDQHEEIDIPIELRPILDSLKEMMHMDPDVGVYYDSLIRGKLRFIDKYSLPISVKYQAYPNSPSEIHSPNPFYDHVATNESDPPYGPPYQRPSFEWICDELEAGEDVELLFGYYCDTTITIHYDTIELDTLEDGTVVMDTVTLWKDVDKRVRKGGHYVTITGKITLGPVRILTYKQDVYQHGQGGTADPTGTPYTDFAEWIKMEDGRAYLNEESYELANGDSCYAIVDAVISESFDPTIDFCSKKVFIPDDAGEATLRGALSCAEDGDTITIGSQLTGDTIKLTSDPIIIENDVVIMSDPSLDIYIKGDSVDRVFVISEGVNVTLDGLRIICGQSLDACSAINAGNLLLRNVEFYNHDGEQGGASQIINYGTIKIEGTTKLRK